MSEELTLHEAALRLYDYGPRIEMASTEEELIRLCDERDKLLSFFREADASRASPTPPTTEGWLPNFSQIYSELEKARENLNRRYLNNNDQSAGRSSRAVFSAMRLLDTARALLSSPRAEDVRREVWKEAARIAGRW